MDKQGLLTSINKTETCIIIGYFVNVFFRAYTSYCEKAKKDPFGPAYEAFYRGTFFCLLVLFAVCVTVEAVLNFDSLSVVLAFIVWLFPLLHVENLTKAWKEMRKAIPDIMEQVKK